MSTLPQATSKLSGPLEDGAFPERLLARVVTPGAVPRLHGYDVEDDLARHYGPSEIVLLALTGELPTPDQAKILEIAFAFLAPVSVAHASTHAAVLARLCGTSTSSIVGTAAIALGEQARSLVHEHVDLLGWLKSPEGDLPMQYKAVCSEDHEAVLRMYRALQERSLTVRGLTQGPTRTAALVLALYASGLRRPERIEAAIVIARMPAVVAEALAERPTNFAKYPINLPRFSYEESQ
jgi:hypothetical protein